MALVCLSSLGRESQHHCRNPDKKFLNRTKQASMSESEIEKSRVDTGSAGLDFPCIEPVVQNIEWRTYSMAVSSNGDLLACSDAVARVRCVRLYSTVDISIVRVLENCPDEMYAASFSPCGRFVAFSGYGWGTVVWDIVSGDIVLSVRWASAWGSTITFSPDGSLLIFAGSKKVAVVETEHWSQVLCLSTESSETGKICVVKLGSLENTFLLVICTPAGLAAITLSKASCAWTGDTSVDSTVLTGSAGVGHCSADGSGRTILVSGSKGLYVLHRTATGFTQTCYLSGNFGVSDIMQNGRFVAAYTRNNKVVVYRLPELQMIAEIDAKDTVEHVQFSPDCRYLYICAREIISKVAMPLTVRITCSLCVVARRLICE